MHMATNIGEIEEYSQKTIELAFYSALLYNQNIGKHRHLFFEFTYCINGNITNIVNGKNIPTTPMSGILLMCPGDVHEMEAPANPDDTPKWHRDIYCMKDKMRKICEFLKPGLYEEILNEKEPILIPCSRETLADLEHSMDLFRQSSLYSQTIRKEQDRHHTAIIFRLLDLYLLSKREKKEIYPEWINAFLQSLSDEHVLCQSIEEITSKYNYSRGYLCREFKKHVGRPMVKVLNESRIVYSTILLANSNLSILDIALRLNFSSQAAYSNAFKAFYGISPKKWRSGGN